MKEVEGKLALIEYIREKNNRVWMDLVRLAVKHAPREELRQIFEEIEQNDRDVNLQWASIRKSLQDSP